MDIRQRSVPPGIVGLHALVEPTYDTLVDGATPDVLAAAAEFGKRHAQEMVLIAKKVKKGEKERSTQTSLLVFCERERLLRLENE